MKKIILLFGLFVFSSNIFAQQISMLHPTLVIWTTGNNKVSLTDAKYGVIVEDNVTLNVYFHDLYFTKLANPSDVSLEFRWYYYLSTSRRLMYIDNVSYSNAIIAVKENVVLFKSVQKNLQPGWWEVQIVNSKDQGFLEIGNVSKFQIFVK